MGPTTSGNQPRLRQAQPAQRTGRAKKNHKASTFTQRQSMLTDRLQEIVVFELHEDGSREYKTQTLRGLYNYVMKAITSTNRPNISGIAGESARSSWALQKYDPTSSLNIKPKTSGCQPAPIGLEKPTRARSGSVGVNTQSTELPPPPPFFSSPETTKMSPPTAETTLPPALASSGSFSRPSLRSSGNRVSFLTPTPAGSSRLGGSGDASQGDGELEQQQPNPAQNLQGHVTYRERLGAYLHPRDMRRLVTPFSSTNEPELIVRRHVMLLNVDPLRAIVLRDRLLVLVPDGADSILIDLERKLRGGLSELEKSIFGEEKHAVSTATSVDDSTSNSSVIVMASPWDRMSTASDHAEEVVDERGHSSSPVLDSETEKYLPVDERNKDSEGNNANDTASSSTKSNDSEIDMEVDEWEELETRQWIDMSFELQAVDAILSSVSALLANDATELRRKVCIAMAALRGDSSKSSPGDHAQEKLRILKDGVGEMEARVQGITRALNLVLDEDEDMALMNLSRLITHPERFIQPVSQDILEEESDEPELILEAYLQQSLSTANTLQLLKGQIGSTEELVAMKLDAVRNRLLYISTMVSIASLCVAMASLVGSIFGMNLLNNLEEDSNAFAQVLAGTLIASVGLFCVLSYAAYRSGVLPRGVF